ncbi:MAG: NnrU family protein [Thermoanaerobaculales bacterium]|nr:NnrU family protein [Thermoanaerobaculales bacterium]
MLLTLLITFSLAFAFTHVILSHGGIRASLVEKLGVLRFRALYSLVALGTFAPAAVIAFTERHLGPVLWDLPRWLELVVALPLMLFALELIILSLATPSPVSLVPAKVEARGVLRITRHPMNMGWALFGLAHLTASGALGDVVFFGACFVFVGIVGAYHLDRRKHRQGDEAFTAFFKETSVLPFVAILFRRQRLVFAEMPAPMLFLGLVAWMALVFFHGRLFGAPLF